MIAYRMRKPRHPREVGFDRYDEARLAKAIKGVEDKRTFLRLKAVLLFVQGMSVEAVAKLFDKSIQAVYHWTRRYLKEHDPGALFDAPKSGRPLSAQSITDERILKELKRNPLKLGYRTTVWTVEILALHLSHRYACPIRPFTLYRRMKAMGLRSKRPRYVYSEKDPNRAQKKGRSCES